jgi:hypothetical protein
LAKYHLSQTLYAVHFFDLEPNRAQHLALSRLPDIQLRIANAIVAAYGVLEDLGVEIRASKEKPARLPNGQWNPEVRQPLEARLLAAGVDVNQPLLWTIRGSRRRLEAERPIPSRGKYPWSRGWIRDCQVAPIDAVAHVSWLRSKVASHGFKSLVKGLSPYDAFNAQHLAARVLLALLHESEQTNRTHGP